MKAAVQNAKAREADIVPAFVSGIMPITVGKYHPQADFHIFVFRISACADLVSP